MELEGEAGRLAKRPVTFKRLTGLSVEQFIKLLWEVLPLLIKAETRRLMKRHWFVIGKPVLVAASISNNKLRPTLLPFYAPA